MSANTRVLVIEDDQEINELLGEYLALENITYVQALTGQAGLQAAAAERPDAVILDLMLPDIDGYEIARQLSTRRSTFDVPVLMLTCMNQSGDRQRGFAAGALHYMNKPFLPDDLLGVLHQALKWKNAVRTRPPQGTLYVSTASPIEALRQLNDMIADLFARTTLSDAAVASIREAFENLIGWALEWGETNRQDPKLTIDYRLLAGDEVATAKPATQIEWVLSEAAPALLSAAFFQAPAPEIKPAGAIAGPVSTVASTVAGGAKAIAGLATWAFGRGGAAGGTDKDAAETPALPTPNAAGTAANWFQFLGKTGAGHFNRDSATQRVQLIRELNGEQGVPVCIADGTRSFPHRVREEALATRRK